MLSPRPQLGLALQLPAKGVVSGLSTLFNTKLNLNYFIGIWIQPNTLAKVTLLIGLTAGNVKF